MAVQFESSGDLLYLTSSPPARVSRTMLLWVRVDSDQNISSTQFIARYADAGGSIRQGLVLNNVGSAAQLGLVAQSSGGVSYLIDPYTVSTWYPMAVVTRQGSGVLESDGYSGATVAGITLGASLSSIDTADTSASFSIGGTGAENMGISVAYCRIWNAELTLSEIKAEFGSTTPVRTSGLYADYRFGNGALTTDSSGNGHTLTVNATPVFTADPTISASGRVKQWPPQLRGGIRKLSGGMA